MSGLFYDYDKGPASYEAPLELSAVRYLHPNGSTRIRMEKWSTQFESDVKIDDEILMAELGSGGSIALKNIVRRTIRRSRMPLSEIPRIDHW